MKSVALLSRSAWLRTRSRSAAAICGSLALAWAALSPTPAAAFEAADGRLQAHGYFEMQFRTISRNFSDQWDLTQWYNVFNLELELDIVQETHGPLDLVSAFVRIEARYDCVYSRGCGMVRGVDVYGDRARRMPGRLQGGDQFTNAGSIFISNDGPWSVTPERNPYRIQETPAFRGIYDSTPEGLGEVDRLVLMQCGGGASVGTGGSAYCPDDGTPYRPGRLQPRFWDADRNRRIAAPDGTEIDDGTEGAPFLVAMQDFRDFEFTAIPVIGGSNYGHPTAFMGPWLPKNTVEPIASLANLPNPLDFSRVSPQSLSNGAGGNPMRPIPIYREDDAGRDYIWIDQAEELDGSPAVQAGRWEQINPTDGRFSDVRLWNDEAAQADEARGAFVPTSQLRRAMRENWFSDYPFNISQTDRAFNRGQSQNDEGELKEAYLDIEMFDSRLWLRIGKQSIVWGKTELFRTTDQFNPQDFALATLPSLEESRINLWAARGVWSFYEVGPLTDVRLELAMNFDEFEPADLGACGEPYAINLVCSLTLGSWAHGLTGVGVAGFKTPPNPWDSTRGLEFGGRLEWRWDRYSFALVDFYGYSDFPNPVRLATYSRNVDWKSGRPRYYMHTVEQMAAANFSCATPDGKGLAFAQNPVTGGDDFTVEPLGPASRVSYDRAGEAGCVTPGPSNRQVRVLQTLAGGQVDEWYGAPYRVPVSAPNELLAYQGNFLNNTMRADPDDPRYFYSRATVANPTSATDWPSYRNSDDWARVFDAGEVAKMNGCAGDPDYDDPSNPGNPISECRPDNSRVFDDRRYIQPDAAGPILPNPSYNPFYDPRLDPHFDVSVSDGFAYSAAPGDVIAATPVLFDPFQVGDVNSAFGHSWWANGYNPSLEYDERNSLDLSSVNASIFNFVCVATVGFSDLDPSACALTVFSSSKKPGGSNSNVPRISTVISAFLSGSPLFNGFVGKFPTDELLSKGPLLPDGMGMPLVQMHADLGTEPAVPPLSPAPRIGVGLDSFRTTDVRRHWADVASGQLPARNSKAYPWIYSRETESYNCLPDRFLIVEGGGAQLCGGLAIAGWRTNPILKYRAVTFLSRALSPEQEALLGCGPFFGTACDSNGADFLWAEGSALLQSFIGSDSLGVAFSQMGIENLVPADFGAAFMDNGSPSQEYRTDGRVVDKNGRLIRIDPDTLTPALGSSGYLNGIGVGNVDNRTPTAPRGDCDITASRIVMPDGQFDQFGNLNLFENRISSRCWDLRQYFVAYGVQPGTAAFEILGLGGPKCTTADIGGPTDPRASVLPGCRNKWATIQYQPLDPNITADQLHPNNPDAGYIGNNWYGQIFSYKAAAAAGRPTPFDPDTLPDPRSDYRQWSADPQAHVRRDMFADTNGTELAGTVPCAVANTPQNPGSLDGPESYDCYLRNPGYTPQPNDGNAKWQTDYAAIGNCASATPDPRCFSGPDGLDGEDLQDRLPASIRLSSAWAQDGTDNRYELAKISRRSGLNWGVYDPALSGCDTSRPVQQQQDDPDCYVGGWRQGVDGDPDRLGIDRQSDGGLLYPRFVRAIGNNLDLLALAPTTPGGPEGSYGSRVENGCTPGTSWIYLQRTADNRLLSPPECANVYTNPLTQADGSPLPSELLFGAGHPFTGESFSSEIAGASFNLMQLLVTFSEEFTDGLASVRGFVNPELYESRFIYDEEWMWNPECAPPSSPLNNKTLEECGGRWWIQDTQFPYDPDRNSGDPHHSAYGDPNRDPLDVDLKRFDDPGYDYRVRQAFKCLPNPDCSGTVTGINLNSRVGWQSTGLGNTPEPGEAVRANKVPNPIPPGATNKLQRDPSLPNIMTTFPDLLMRECNSARRDYQDGMTQAQIRGLYDDCGTLANGGVNDWTARGSGFWQDLRLGNSGGQGGLVESMLWDYAFTGTENDLMALIPYCENLEFTQRHTDSIGDSNQQPNGQSVFGPTRIDCTRGEQGEVLGRERCTYVTPQYCGLVQAVFSLAGQKRPILQAGGNGTFGRRTMQWHSGNEIYLDYAKRNVLGFSMDFAEDYTKSNWSVEFTWIEGVPQIDNSSYNLTTEADDFNLTVSMDRPTFVNFLNANRTLFINSQWFFQYRKGWNDDFSSIGPWNVLATFTVFTGYFQDRLNPTLTFVYDFRSNSGGALPQVNYRFSEAFSMTVGVSLFWGEQRLVNMPLNPIAPAGPRGGPNPYMDGTQPGLSLVRDRDEAFMILRYTF